ncbi:MAG: hypothetical protein ACUZ8O_15305, partial [Candidatus Anammoxibacter sp.]
MYTEIIIAICSSIAGIYIGYFCSIKTARYIGFSQTSTKLICAFSEELALLRTGEGDVSQGYRLLKCAFNKHLIAITEFRQALPKTERSSFDKAWYCYCGNENNSDKTLGKYYDAYELEGRQEAIKNI